MHRICNDATKFLEPVILTSKLKKKKNFYFKFFFHLKCQNHWIWKFCDIIANAMHFLTINQQKLVINRILRFVHCNLQVLVPAVFCALYQKIHALFLKSLFCTIYVASLFMCHFFNTLILAEKVLKLLFTPKNVEWLQIMVNLDSYEVYAKISMFFTWTLNSWF